MKKKCKQCREAVIEGSTRKKYCDVCSKERKKASDARCNHSERSYKGSNVKLKPCEECGKNFASKRPDSKLCSAKCRMRKARRIKLENKDTEIL